MLWSPDGVLFAIGENLCRLIFSQLENDIGLTQFRRYLVLRILGLCTYTEGRKTNNGNNNNIKKKLLVTGKETEAVKIDSTFKGTSFKVRNER